MPLFHPRVIDKKTKNAGSIPPDSEAILAAWARSLKGGAFDGEIQSDAEFIQRILIDVLGYEGSSAGSTWTLAKNQSVGMGNVDVALGSFSADQPPVILALLELKGAKTKDLDAVMPGRQKSPVQQAWEYAIDTKGAKWVLVSNYREMRLYAVGYGRKDYERFDLTTITEPENYHRFMLLLAARNLLSGETAKLLKESDAAEKEITNSLYAEYKETRSHLINEIIASLPDTSTAVELAQIILDRVLFIAFAEDKGLLKKNTIKDAFTIKNPYNPQPAWENFKGLFRAIDKGNTHLNIPGYNGGLFAENSLIDNLTISDTTCKRFADLAEYDYDSDVSVNILGHVFEQSISDLEDIKRSLDPTATQQIDSKRKTDGIFYTPPFITRHIVEQTVGKWLADRKDELGFDTVAPLTDADYASIRVIERGKNKGQVASNANVQKHIAIWEAYRAAMSRIKFVDSGCGSGAFLNEVFDYLYREGQAINRTLELLHGGQINLFRWDTHILANNIFGVDINKESIEITKLSLWLKTANPNEKLSYLDDNIKAGNSLIKDESVAGDLAFDWKRAFPKIMQAGGFDIVVGNPPYVDSEAMTKAWPREREYITRNFQQARGNWDLYIAFLELGCDLLSSNGYLSFITPDKWISKDFGSEMRKRVAPGLVSILPAGRGVFESALVDSIVTTVSNRPVPQLQILSVAEGEITVAATIDKAQLDSDEGFDQLLSPQYPLLRKLETLGRRRLSDIANTENACATSDTYTLGEILTDAGSIHAYDPSQHYKVANTGTLDRFGFRWGVRPMRYLKHDYAFPIVAKNDFREKLGATYQRRAASPKIMIKGLTLLDAALDQDGSFIPGKSTLVICTHDAKKLKLLAGLLNSKLASFYVKQKYASASYNGGVSFTPDMLNSIPIPDTVDDDAIVRSVETLMRAQEAISATTSHVHGAIRAAGASGTLRKKLDHWYELTSPEFIQELSRQGLSPSVREKAEWAEFYDENKAKLLEPLRHVKEAQEAIDKALLEAYGLSAADCEQIYALS